MFQINKSLNARQGVAMIEKVLEMKKHELPEGKTMSDFGGGYVEMLKTKAKVVLYFGFNSTKNRVSINFQIKKEEVVLWTEAIAEKIWNKDVEINEEIISFDIEPDEESTPATNQSW